MPRLVSRQIALLPCVILNLGVNDITEADAYISYYKQLFDSIPLRTFILCLSIR